MRNALGGASVRLGHFSQNAALSGVPDTAQAGARQLELLARRHIGNAPSELRRVAGDYG